MNEGSSCFLVPVTAVCPLQKEDPRGKKKAKQHRIVVFIRQKCASQLNAETHRHTQTHLHLSRGRETTAVALQQLFLIYYKVRWPRWYAETSHVSLSVFSQYQFICTWGLSKRKYKGFLEQKEKYRNISNYIVYSTVYLWMFEWIFWHIFTLFFIYHENKALRVHVCWLWLSWVKTDTTGWKDWDWKDWKYYIINVLAYIQRWLVSGSLYRRGILSDNNQKSLSVYITGSNARVFTLSIFLLSQR